jgi:hypothetical protein
MYIPLVAAFFAPFSYLDPNLALFFWQVLSVIALALSSLLLSHVTGVKASQLFFLSFLYFPVFLTLWAGQLGLLFGLLPLSWGYVLVLKQKPLAAGLVWSALILKPQFLLVGGFVALLSALERRYRILIGLAVGFVAFFAATVLLFSPRLTLQWLASHRVSDAYFFSGQQGIPAHLLTGLPANILVLLPLDLRASFKWPLYAGAAAMWLYGIWICFRSSAFHLKQPAHKSSALVIGLALTSLTLPHLLYYDLSVLMPAGALLLARNGPLPRQKYFKAIGLTGWIVVSAFLPLLLAYNHWTILPLILELILLALLLAFLRALQPLSNGARDAV